MQYIALLRGINVGGHNPVRMADLRALFEAVGATDVATYIQSGNVVFSHRSRSPSTLAVELSLAVVKRFRIKTAVVLRTQADLEALVDENPFPDAPRDTLHVMFLHQRPSARDLDPIDADAHAPGQMMVIGREIHLALPRGVGHSKLVATLAKLGGTMRNWRTIQALLAMSGPDAN